MRCFVISPIGTPGSEMHQHANDVFDFIIKPACERAGIKPERADHDTRAGIITDQMYDAILGHDLLIAILSFHNPNVFYEIAIAEAAARPLILMIQSSESIPFDIKDRRVLSYDLRPRALFEKTHEDLLYRAIMDTIAARETAGARVPFRTSLSPLGAKSTGDLDITRRLTEFDPRRRVELINGAKQYVVVRALANSKPALKDEQFAALRDAAKRGVKIRMLLMAPENPALPEQIAAPTPADLARVKGEIDAGVELWRDSFDGRINIRLQTRGFMHGMFQASENASIFTPYSLATRAGDSPCMWMRSDHRLSVAAMTEFDHVWKHDSRPADPPRAKANRAGKGRRVSRKIRSSPPAGGRDRPSR